MTLILDDYQVIEEPEIHQALTFLIEHAPICLRIVLATRHDPPLPLATLRARRQVVELRDGDLALTLAETATLLEQLVDKPLSEEEVFQLRERTQGWITGLLLAALALRTHPDPPGFVQSFAGTHQFVLDYLRQAPPGFSLGGGAGDWHRRHCRRSRSGAGFRPGQHEQLRLYLLL